jgi:charged multivesicular body protein 2A
MEWLFGKVLTPEEVMKNNVNLIRKSIREIEREIKKMEIQEVKTINEIKKSAAANNKIATVRIMAIDLVRTRNHVKKMGQMKTRLQAVLITFQSIKSQSIMSNAMKNVTIAMCQMNRQINLPALTQIMKEFEIQSTTMEMKDELIQETMESLWDEDGEEADIDEIVNQVYDELGIKLESDLVSTPKNNNNNKSVSVVKNKNSSNDNVEIVEFGHDDADTVLQNRLDNLK